MLYETRLRHDLEHTRARLMRQTALIWVSMVEATWRHGIIQQAGAIRLWAGGLLRDLEREEVRPERVQTAAREIDSLAEAIADAPPRVPQSWETESEPIRLFSLLVEIADWQNRHRPSEAHSVEVVMEAVEGFEVRRIRGYRRWLTTALEYLLHNAAAAMEPKKGGKTRIVCTVQGARAELRVIDSGVGVPKKIRAKLFREAIPPEEDESGMGLGALMAATIIEAHDGSIELEKTGPDGTTVLVRLPTMKEEQRHV
jgi:signal transduction histidine kinase